MRAWTVDADDIRVAEDFDESLLHRTPEIDGFLTPGRDDKFIVIGTKGFGKTLLLKAKRILYQREGRAICLPSGNLLDKPIGDEWRGTIHPESWDDWWDSYRDMIQVFSSVAAVHHADMLVIGSELVSTEPMLEQWTKTIQLARSNFKGKLIYSSNWDHYEAVTFWSQLDMVGMNSYWKMGPDRNVTVEQVQERWKEIQSDLFPFLKKVQKPLMFLEVGWFSQANAAHEPWDYTKPSEPLDLELQSKLYEAFFRSWYGNPMLGGFSIWEWPPNTGGPEDKGYTPEGKPALEVLKTWLKKGKWEVK